MTAEVLQARYQEKLARQQKAEGLHLDDLQKQYLQKIQVAIGMCEGLSQRLGCAVSDLIVARGMEPGMLGDIMAPLSEDLNTVRDLVATLEEAGDYGDRWATITGGGLDPDVFPKDTDLATIG